MANRLKKFLKSFTLIELIIVIAIIAVLGVSAFLLLSQWISKGRDARKISDIQTIQKSLEIRAMETGLYPMPDGEVIEGKIDGAKLSYLGEIGEGVINKLGNITKIPQDPKTKKGYKYGVTYDGKEYEIGAVLESGKKQALIVGGVLASDLEQKVIGKYDGYITYENNNKYYIANIPSLLYNYDGITTNGADLDGNQIYYTVEGGENLLYDLQGNPVNKVRGKKIVEDMYSVIDYGVKALEITGSVSDLTPEQIKVLGGEEKAAIIFNEKPTGTDIASLEKVDGECGTANGGSFATSIEGGLCLKGTSTSVILNENKFQWSCEGINEGTTASCEASKLVVAPPEEGFSKIAVGGNFTCMIDGNKDLRCWGSNISGIMLNGKSGRGQYEANPVKIDKLSNIKSVGAGVNHICILNESNEVFCWGGNNWGQVGNNTLATVTTPYKTLSDIDNIYISRESSCAQKTNGDVYCWGSNLRFQIDNSQIDMKVPTKIQVSSPIGYSIGNAGFCYINSTYQGYCRGHSSVLNSSSVNSQSFQLQISNAKKMLLGAVSVTVLSNDGNVYVWGRNDGVGELGNNSYTDSIIIGTYTIFNNNDIEDIYIFNTNICAKKNNGEIWCWGDNYNNQITQNDIKAKIQPVKYDAPNDNLGFAISQTHSCYIKGNGEYKCIGNNVFGQLGNGLADLQHIKLLPDNYDHLSFIEKSSLKDNHNFGIDENGQIWGWGYNQFGQIGNGNYENQINFVKMQGLESVKFEKIVGYHSSKCGLTDDKKLYCWGRNNTYQLGEYIGTTSVNPLLMNISDIKDIFGTNYGVIVLTNGGEVKSLGWRPLLGRGITIFSRLFDSVKKTDGQTLTGVKQVDARLNHACALTNDGQVYCWGDNLYYQVGSISGGIDGDSRYINKAINLGLNQVKSIFLSTNHSCALLENDEVYCWGLNTSGQIGIGNTINQYIPKKVLGLEGKVIKSINSGYNHSCAVTSESDMYCWGNNSNGQLGDGTRIHRNLPVRVQGISNVQELIMGGDYTCAKKDSGSLYCWGNLWKFGQLGK